MDLSDLSKSAYYTMLSTSFSKKLTKYRSILSHLTTPATRADVLAWYVTTSTLGSAVGSEVSGRIVHALQSRGYSLADAYHVLFWSYALMGLLNVAFTLMLTEECEMSEAQTPYTRIPQQDYDASVELSQATAAEHLSGSFDEKPREAWYRRFWKGFSGRLSQISAPTRSVMYKLWFLLAVDSLADGMVPYSLTNYYLEEKFNPSKSTLGDVNGIAYLLGAISTVFAGPLARRIGLVNTMVFTHIPSSAAVLVFPVPKSLALTVILLFIRAGLNNMDQAPRSAFIAGVVKPSERTAAMGITAIVRTLAATTGPTLTGILAGSHRFWIAFVAAGACRLVYDVGLYVLFINTKLHQHEGGIPVDQMSADTPRTSDEEDMTELQPLDHTNGKIKPTIEAGKPERVDVPGQNERLIPESQSGVRKRSPSPLARAPAGPP